MNEFCHLAGENGPEIRIFFDDKLGFSLAKHINFVIKRN